MYKEGIEKPELKQINPFNPFSSRYLAIHT